MSITSLARLRTILTALAAAAACAGCNVVYSDRPLFGPQDAVGAPTLHDGLWRSVSDDCRVDERRPAHRWPDCAPWAVVRAGEVLTFDNGRWTAHAGLAAAGTPVIVQTTVLDPDGAARRFLFHGLRVDATDADGAAIAVTAWPVQCGPPPPPGAGRSGTLEPLAGLSMDADGGACTTSSPDAVRAAAAASEGWSEPVRMRWVRDGWR